MAGGRSPKNKGNNFERELVRSAQASGLPARRAWGSNGRALGFSEEVDLVIGDAVTGEITVQAKRRASVAKWLIPANHGEDVKAVAFREDHGAAHVVIDYETFLDLLANLREIRVDLDLEIE